MSRGDWDYNSDGEEENVEEQYNARQALIIGISANQNMFRANWGEGSDRPMKAALKICDSIMRSKIASTPKDKVGIVLFDTEHAENSSNFENLYVLKGLTEITTVSISELHERINSEDLGDFEDKIGNSDSCKMSELFWLAKIMFDEGATKSMSRKLLIITNEDDPHAGDDSLRISAVQKFKDLGKLDLNVITFNKGFNWDKFYRNIHADESVLTYAEDMQSLLQIVRIRQRLKRPLVRSSLIITDGIKVPVGVYSLVRPAKKPQQVKVDKRTNEPVEKCTNLRDADGALVLKSEITKSITVGGETLEFTQEELKDLKYKFESGISVLKYVDREEYDAFGEFRSPGYFIYPNEEEAVGSKDLFISLLKGCVRKKKVGLVEFTLTRGSSPKLGYLVPCVQKHSRSAPTFPQGFYLAVKPFAGDSREHEVPEAEPSTETMKTNMKRTVQRLKQNNFDVTQAQNPELYALNRAIETTALNLPNDDEHFADFTQPNVSLMRERVGPNVLQINMEVLHLQYEPAKKKPRKTAAPAVDFDMENECRHDRLAKLTVAVLKAFTDEKNIEVKGYPGGKYLPNKAMYIAAIKKYFAGQQ